MTLHVDPKPCSTCPYRKDVPPGIWAEEEYQKLRGYDDGAQPLALATFLCHQSTITDRETVCRGWLSVHCESVAVRLAEARGEVPPGAKYDPVPVPLYATGNEAADAGLRGVKRPSRKARREIDKLTVRKKRKGR